MDIILYNPYSRSGNKEDILKITRKKLKLKEDEYVLESIVNIEDPREFIKKYQDVNSFIIFGGDGTLNVLANHLIGLEIKPDVYFYASGTGNDFVRSVKVKGRLVNLKDYLINLPTVTFNNETKVFINGVGLGLDAMVCHKVNNSKFKKSKFNYFRHAIESFRESVKTDLYVNDKLHKDVWFVSCMNDKYFGGGMKIAPKASRFNDTLDIVIVKRAPKWILTLIFPIIYFGIHPILKRYVEIIRVKEAHIKYLAPKFLQLDGEDFTGVSQIYVTKNKEA